MARTAGAPDCEPLSIALTLSKASRPADRSGWGRSAFIFASAGILVAMALLNAARYRFNWLPGLFAGVGRPPDAGISAGAELAMQYNLSACVMALGLGLAFHGKRWRIATMFSGLVAVAVASIVVLQHFGHGAGPIYHWLAPNAAARLQRGGAGEGVCLIALGVSVVLLWLGRVAVRIAAILSASVFTVALAALVSSALGAEHLYHGGFLARLPIQSAVCLAILCAGVLAAEGDFKFIVTLTPRGSIPALLGFAGFAATMVCWHAHLLDDHLAAQGQAQVVAAQCASRIETLGEQTERTLARMADRWPSQRAAGDPAASDSLWRSDAGPLFRDFKGLLGIEWVDQYGEPRRERAMAPALFDKNVPLQKAIRDTAKQAISSGKQATSQILPLAAAGPARADLNPAGLIDGDWVVTIAVPVRNSVLPYALVFTIELHSMLEQLLRGHEADNYYIHVTSGGHLLHERDRAADADAHVSAASTARALGLRWNIEAAPEASLAAENVSLLGDAVILAGLLMTGLLVLASNVWLLARDQNQQLKKVNAELVLENEMRGRTERALKVAKEAADEASHAKSMFLAAMSHEIRTPMNAILGMADLLWDTTLTRAQRDYVRVFRSSGASLLALLNDILDFSKIEAGRFDLANFDFELQEVVSSTSRVMEPRLAEKKLWFTVDLARDVPAWLNGDADRLQQVLINLLSNASKFTQTGGVMLRVTCPVRSAGRCTLRFEVIDTGIGIPEDKRKLIFESFQQGDNSISRRFGGTGLGLAISRGLVERMGGQLTVESEIGKGSNFSFTAELPIAAPHKLEGLSELREAVSVPVIPAAAGDAFSILVVDDVPENQFVIQSYLEGFPYKIDCCDDGLSAVEKFKQTHYDLILMDIRMPILDGLGATRQIRAWELAQNWPPTPIIALSADGLPAHKQESLDVGCTEHLLKPISKKALLGAVVRYSALKDSGNLDTRLAGQLELTAPGTAACGAGVARLNRSRYRAAPVREPPC